ncbi:MAG: hypothetical protein DHS20C05_03550 [Hyphococcus sp.]|nr:MAG: hypothetical protein DHS20C05_03550 [Marinicaulis sp.]
MPLISHPARLILSSAALLIIPFASAAAFENPQNLAVATNKGDMRDDRAPEALGKLAFLIGDWDIESAYDQPDGSVLTSKARMTGRYTLGGFGVETQGVHATLGNPDIDVFVSTHIYMVHPKSGDIAAIAINTLGNRKFNDGEFIGEDFIVIASGEMFNGADVINRSRFFNMTEDRFQTALEVSEDGGKTWQDAGYSSVYTRVK